MTVAISIKNIRKTYGLVVAVDDCSFELREAEIHVLLGTNGCGKSTLCKIIAGAIGFDQGQFDYFGRNVRFSGPLEARRQGIATVYQELSLNPTQTVADNIFLGNEPSKFAFKDRQAMTRQTRVLFEQFTPLCQDIDPESRVGDLSIDQRQIVEIAKALVLKPKIILFDESTSSLDRRQVETFFGLVRQLKRDGCSIIFISHRMEEIFEIGDRVTVMRNGRHIDTLDIAATDRRQLIDLMVGDVGHNKTVPDKPLNVRNVSSPPILTVEELTTRHVGPISFTLHSGEILGLGGLHGQGQSDFLLALLGDIDVRAGTITYCGERLRAHGPRARLKKGIAYVSGDRGRDGALHGRSIFENLATSLTQKEAIRIIGTSKIWHRILPLIKRLKLRYGHEHDAIESLSGGNQQKVIVGRAFATHPRILLLDDPTKGIDVAAKADLFEMIKELRREGICVILYSSEDNELLENADRIAVFNAGQITAMLEGDHINEFELYSAALGRTI